MKQMLYLKDSKRDLIMAGTVIRLYNHLTVLRGYFGAYNAVLPSGFVHHANIFVFLLRKSK